MNDKSRYNIDNIARTSVKIIGFGNKFRSDDGIGLVVIEELEKLDIASNKNIEIIDGGTSGSDLIFHLKECPRVIIVDALDAGQASGEVISIREKDIDKFGNGEISSLSLHDLNLADILKLSRALKLKTNITIIGIKPINMEFGEELSPEIKSKIPEIISEVEKALKSLQTTGKNKAPVVV